MASDTAASAVPEMPRTVGTLDTSKELGVHLRAWSLAQVAFADAVLEVAPYLDHDQLVTVIRNLRRNAERDAGRYV